MGSAPGGPVVEALEMLREHDRGEDLGSLVAEALLARAEESARQGAKAGLVDAPTAAEDLPKEARSTGLGDPLEILEKGPASDEERALLEAALGLGLAARLGEAEADDRRDAAAALLDRLDWLEAHTPLSPYRGLSVVLEGEASDLFWDEVAAGLVRRVREDQEVGGAASRRGALLAVVRASALSEAPEGARTVLAGRIAADMPAGTVKRVALAALAGVDDADAESAREAERNPAASVRAAAAARAPRLEGALEGRPWGTVARVVAALTGVLLLRWLVLLAMRFLLGHRREGALVLGASTVKVEHRVRLLGRVIRSGETSYSLRSLRSGGVEVRFRFLHLLVGAILLVLGAAIGVSFLVEGSCVGYPPLVFIGIAMVVAGLALDLLLEVLVPAKKGVCTLSLDMGRKWARLRGVDETRAKEFTAALDQLLPEPAGRARRSASS